jgi:bifunctional DNase/RNase
VELVDARPSDELNLVALVPAPIFVAGEVLAEAEASRMGGSAEAVLLRRALGAEQMTVRSCLRSGSATPGRPGAFSPGSAR